MKHRVFAFLAAFFFAGCLDVLSPPETRTGGDAVLVVHIAGESSAGRTALPPDAPAAPAGYTIRVSRGAAALGSASFTAGLGSYSVELTNAPAAGDIVQVEGFNGGGGKTAEGIYMLPPGYNGDDIAITLYPSRDGTGTIDLAVGFPLDGYGEGNDITAVEVSLYQSLANYDAGTVYEFTRYRKASGYGEGENLASPISIYYGNVLSGNYVVQIDFFRFKFVRVSRLVQTIIVRDGLTTNSWDGGSKTLTLTADYFASSNADLTGISIGGTTLSFTPGIYNYAQSVSVSDIPNSVSLAVTSNTPGQAVAVSLNGVPAASLTPLQAANSIAIIVTAPDGVTTQTYAVGYTYVRSTGDWYVADSGNDSTGAGTADDPYASVAKALGKIRDAYNGGSSWPGGSANPVAARINISGIINENVSINGGSLPPIILLGGISPGTICAIGNDRPLIIEGGAKVIMEGDLTLTGGSVESDNGGGVYITGDSSFTMNGGAISGNEANPPGPQGNGGGVSVSNSTFTMNGGTISGNTSGNLGGGGGVHITAAGSFTMNGGTIGGSNLGDGNTALNGGGVSVSGNGSIFTMNGGTIVNNMAAYGGNGSDIGNGGGVSVSDGVFIMNGGTISGNTASNTYSSGNNRGNGGGVYITGNAGFTMNGGAISGNTASANGGTNSGNGGGVYFTGSAVFTMSGAARVDTGPGNEVSFFYNKVITLYGILSTNPAANIASPASVPGTPVLGGDIPRDNNYKKFWLNGASNVNGDEIGVDGKIR